MDRNAVFPPGSTIGILGGGQLGKMTALAAYQLGYKVVVWCQSEDEPLAQIATYKIIAPWDDLDARKAFIARADVVTYEFENVPYELAFAIEQERPLRPSAHVLKTTQDRFFEKSFLRQLGIPTALWWPVRTLEELQALKAFCVPAILKTTRGGYDGNKHERVNSQEELMAAWHKLGEAPCILEGIVPFKYEMSIIIARDGHGRTELYAPIQNTHDQGILDHSDYPIRGLPQRVQTEAESFVRAIAKNLPLHGVLATEMFVLEDERVFVNELAPRPHNSGHLTIEASQTSQFEQHVRAVCGLPLGGTYMRDGEWKMQNLLGCTVEDFHMYLRDPCAHVHWYGKKPKDDDEQRRRKVGHVTCGPFY